VKIFGWHKILVENICVYVNFGENIYAKQEEMSAAAEKFKFLQDFLNYEKMCESFAKVFARIKIFE